MRAIRLAAFAVLVLAALVVAAWLCFPPGSKPEPETLRITFDGGGRIDQYIERYSALRLAGGRVVIDGLCISACTMVTGLMPAERVCVTPYAQLAFHSAAMVDPLGNHAHSAEGTRLVWNVYPENVRALLRAKSWDGEDAEANEHPGLIYVAGDELRTLIRPCAPSEM